MNILFFAVGSSLNIHLQAHFAIRSVYLHAEQDDNIYILTDSPILYSGLPLVHTELITEEEKKTWAGERNYFFRIKINAIRKFISNHANEDMMYMDTDIFFHGDIGHIKGLLRKGIGLMHKDEFAMPDVNPKSGSGIMWQQTKGKVYAGITISKCHHMWNSGAVAIPKSVMKDVMDKAISICDEFLDDGVTCFNLEQWAVSIALQEYTGEIIPLEQEVWHYWHYKYVWCKYIVDFFNESYSHHSSKLEWELEAMRSINFRYLYWKLWLKRVTLKLLGLKH